MGLTCFGRVVYAVRILKDTKSTLWALRIALWADSPFSGEERWKERPTYF